MIQCYPLNTVPMHKVQSGVAEIDIN